MFVAPFAAFGQQTQADLDGETEAFAVRVEYDIPLPAGSGTIPHVIGEIRKTSGENSKGLAAAPTNFDALISGAVYDPYSTYNGNDRALHVGSVQTGIKPPIDPHNNLPTAECFYPGNVSKTVSWPRDLRADTTPLPPLAYSNARCGAGPTTHVTAWAASADTPGMPTEAVGAVVHTGPVSGESVLGPEKGVVHSAARASADAVSILGGVIRVGHVEVEGNSSAEGPGGKNGTTGHVALTNVTAGGQTFSVADNELVIAGQSFPIPSDGAKGAIDAVNAALDPSGCSLSLLGPASRYPQGYILSRKPPALGTAKDGTFAASMHGGMLVLCNLPESVTGPTTFTPQRVQILVGFEYTMAKSTTESVGFGVGDLLGGLTTVKTPDRTVVETSRTSQEAPPVASAAPNQNVTDQPQALSPSRRVINYKPLGTATRIVLLLIGIALLLVATNFASRRLRDLIGL